MSNSIFKFDKNKTISKLSNILETPNFFSKYETAIAFALLAMQYLFIAFFPNAQNSEIEKTYIYLWFFDVFLAIPIIILIYFPDRIRRIILLLILLAALIIFSFSFGFNTIYFNTFLALFFANRILLFNLTKEEKNSLISSRIKRFFLVFPVSFIVTVTESVLGKMGIIHHEKLGDGVVMSSAGKIFLFVGYYSLIAYLEYRKVKYPNSKFSI